MMEGGSVIDTRIVLVLWFDHVTLRLLVLGTCFCCILLASPSCGFAMHDTYHYISLRLGFFSCGSASGACSAMAHDTQC